jgi:8-oxo-dGTP pyrophosphatase MutT (NUDIX family)
MNLDSEKLKMVLGGFPRQRLEANGRSHAAVLVGLFEKNGEEHLLFTRRTENLQHHRGEISFPGGEREADDADLCATAVRETEEEIGLRARDIRILGRLDDFQTRRGFHVVPFVGRFPYPYEFSANSEEVAEILEVPLRELADPAIFRYEDWLFEGERHQVCFFTLGSLLIWGLTGAILKQFLELAVPLAKS